MAKKKGGNKKKQQQQQGLLAPLTSTSASNRPVWQGDYTPESLRQQQQGAARGGGSGQQHQAASSNPTAWMRAEHLMRLASWASTEVPPLGALLGMRVASMCQSAAFLPPDISPNVTCQWCESVLKPGMNCSIRVTRPKKKRKAGKYGSVNNITYICHFCKKGSATPGTPKEHVKTKRAQAFARARLTALGSSQTNVVTDASKNSVSLNREREIETNKAGSSTLVQNLPKAPEALLLSSSSTKKRKRKGWATLKDLTLSS
ncbi:unnamed protein product [Sphagnum balticum]